MKRKYIAPEVEVSWMEQEDVIMSSIPGGYDPDGDNTEFIPEV